MPVSYRDGDRARREHHARLRQRDAGGLEQRLEPGGDAEAEEQARPLTPRRRSTSVSMSTERRICLRDAPSVRSVASSRVRCATVIEIVLKITNEPTNSEIPANTSSNTLMIRIPLSRSLEASFTACFGRLDLERGREQRRDRPGEAGLGDARPGGGRDRRRAACLPRIAWAVVEVERGQRDEAAEVAAAELADARDPVPAHRAFALRADRVADAVAVPLGRALVDDDLARAGGPAARRELDRAEAGVRGVDAEAARR